MLEFLQLLQRVAYNNCMQKLHMKPRVLLKYESYYWRACVVRQPVDDVPATSVDDVEQSNIDEHHQP